MTQIIDTAVYDDNDATFPATNVESYLCGLSCDLVQAVPGRGELYYTSALGIAVKYVERWPLFPRDDRQKFLELCDHSPLIKICHKEFTIPWRDLKTLLRLRGAILVHNQGYRNVLDVGPNWAEVRRSYPKVDFDLLGLILAGCGIVARLANYAVHGD